MQIKFNQNRDRVLFINSGGPEYKAMMGFPAFLREGPFFYVPAKVHIVYNVVTRLQKAFKKIAIDKEVLDFMNQDFSLLQLPDTFKFHTSPMDFQVIALRYMYTVGSGGLLLAPGMGKSKVVLDYIALMKFKKSFIVCPKALLGVWIDEVEKHRPDLTIHVMETTNWAEEWELAKDKDIICTNYSKASMLKTEFSKCNFDFIHLDEALIKDHTTARTKDITALSRKIPYKCIGSGTLINNSVLDAYSPIRFLESSLVGDNFTSFLNRHTIRNPRDLRQVVGSTKVDEARSILESCCIVMDKEQWLKLPPKKVTDIYVNIPDQQREFYSNLSRNYIASIDGNFLEVDNALVMMSKLYQVSQGFVYITDAVDENSEEVCDLLSEDVKKKKKQKRNTIFFKEQPKIKALLKLLDTDVKGKRGIIWYNLEAEYQLISNALTEAGHAFDSIKGGTKNISGIVKKFNNDPRISWLVCQMKSVNYGVTILGTNATKLDEIDYEIFPGMSPEVHTQIYYSCSFSLETYLQSMDRTHRIGQTFQCDYYRIFANTKVEHRIRNALDDKLDIRRSMLVDIADTLRETELQETPEKVV